MVLLGGSPSIVVTVEQLSDAFSDIIQLTAEQMNIKVARDLRGRVAQECTDGFIRCALGIQEARAAMA